MYTETAAGNIEVVEKTKSKSTMRKEVPILFSSPMVRAILEGRKTMTRRIINPQPIIDNESGFVFDGKHRSQYDLHNWKDRFIDDWSRWMPGDLLWVRETFFSGYLLDENDCFGDDAELTYWYFADTRDARPGDMSDSRCTHLFGSDKRDWPRWKPSIHMPKAACRIWLEVTEVKIEQLHSIGYADIAKEGLGVQGAGLKEWKELWEKINGADSWVSNPFVWVIEFKVLSTTSKPQLETETTS